MANKNGDFKIKWWTSQTVAVVTGANRGIGFGIARQLAENGLTVVLTARDVKRGLTAVETLNGQGIHNVVFRQLDIRSPSSVSEFVIWLKDNHGGLDILVNNAAIQGAAMDREVAFACYLKSDPTDPEALFNDPMFAKAFTTNYDMSKDCIETNYYGTKRLTEALLPLFRSSLEGARIVNVSSEAGLLKWLRNDSLRLELSDVSTLTEEIIDKMIRRFLDDMKSGGELEGKGWSSWLPQYCVSKLALNAYARLLAQKLNKSEEGTRIYVNNVHPGRINTDMADKVAEGALNCVRVALMAPGGPSGQFYCTNELHSF